MNSSTEVSQLLTTTLSNDLPHLFIAFGTDYAENTAYLLLRRLVY
jgi:hypothetical protein